MPISQPRHRRRHLSAPRLAPTAHPQRGFRLSWRLAQAPIAPLEATTKTHQHGIDSRLVALKPKRALRARGRQQLLSLLAPVTSGGAPVLLRRTRTHVVANVMGLEGVSWGGRGSSALGF